MSAASPSDHLWMSISQVVRWVAVVSEAECAVVERIQQGWTVDTVDAAIRDIDDATSGDVTEDQAAAFAEQRAELEAMRHTLAVLHAKITNAAGKVLAAAVDGKLKVWGRRATDLFTQEWGDLERITLVTLADPVEIISLFDAIALRADISDREHRLLSSRPCWLDVKARTEDVQAVWPRRSKVTTTIKGTIGCTKWYEALMADGAPPAKTAPEYERDAMNMFGVGVRAAKACRAQAITNTRNTSWSGAGRRRSKSIQ